MKTCTTTCNNPDLRDGSSQWQRFLKALDPTNMPIDGRTLEDLLVFTKKLAGQIRFFDQENTATGDSTASGGAQEESWKSFFQNDIAVLAAEIALTDLKALQKSQAENRTDFEEKPNLANFSHLFDALLGMARRINKWYQWSGLDTTLRSDLELLVHSSLHGQLLKCMEYDRGLMIINQGEPLLLDFSELDTEPLWDLPDNPTLDDTIYQGNSFEEKLINAADFVHDIYNAFYQGIKSLFDRSDYYIQQALEQYPSHQPHIALFISFLQLFKIAQQQLNTLTAKHLDFYYRDVLHLAEKPAQPDSVHLIYELAKETAEYVLPQGTELPGGKDGLKKEQIYKTDKELVINSAKVASLKTLFIEKTEDENIISNIFANPLAKSADGLGTPFDSPDAKWHTFGGWPAPKERLFEVDLCKKATFEEKTPRNIAEIGFAIASPDLLLAGGNRKIEIQLNNEVVINLMDNVLAIRLSSEKGWLKIDPAPSTPPLVPIHLEPVSNEIFSSDFKSGFEFFEDKLHIGLGIDEPPIVAFNKELHEGRAYQTFNPVLEVLVSQPDFHNDLYLTENNPISIQVKVGSILAPSPTGTPNQLPTPIIDGVQDLLLQNNDGVIDPSQAIQPFTLYPHIGNSFYVSNNEFANKRIEAVSVQTEWANGAPTSSASVAILGLEKAGVWKELNPGGSSDTRLAARMNTDLLREPEFQFQLLSWHSPITMYSNLDFIHPIYYHFLKPAVVANTSQALSFKAVLNDARIIANRPFTIKAKSGYIRYSLTNGEANTVFEPNRQYQIKSVALAYRTELRPFEAKIDEFFHIYPFGEVETFPTNDEAEIKELEAVAQQLFVSTTKEEIVGARTTHQWWLLPQFRFGNPRVPDAPNQYNQETIQQGNLFIGIENLHPPQNLSLLFHFAEGSALDEDSDPPAVHWSYLSNNEWKPLPDDFLLSDGTYGFQTSGVMLFDIPEDATNNNTVITTGLHWLCASVSEGAEKLPMLIDVIAQAGTATFYDQDNDPAHYNNPLPANSISKLAVKVAEVKKLQQPFASFGGKPKHEGSAFYTFAAERLRHKARAINPWDYEHLVLEQFPSIYKVKCIAHTDPECLCRHTTDATPEICCGPQDAPGHVLVVPIANLRNRNAVNILQPKTARRLLLEIGKYLRKRTSPFVHVHVKNPRYEEILTRFKVKFYSGVDKGYYLRKLNDDLIRYLTPWAFDDFSEVVFGGKVYASEVINFIEERPYVDFITDFEMFHCKEDCCPPEDLSALGARPQVVAGTVSDDQNKLLEEVRVTNKRTLESVYTDKDGKYANLQAVPQDRLIFSHKGYQTQQILVGTDPAAWNIKLAPIQIDWDKINNCKEVVSLVEGEVLTSETLIEASKSDVILVSAPQHLITLYVAPLPPDPCKNK